MLKQFTALCGIACLLATAALANEFPNYYPGDGFQRTGRLDAVQLDNRRVVIDDIPYQLADNVIVHSLTSYSVPAERLQAGSIVGYQTSGARLIMKIWILPRDYKGPGRR